MTVTKQRLLNEWLLGQVASATKEALSCKEGSPESKLAYAKQQTYWEVKQKIDELSNEKEAVVSRPDVTEYKTMSE